MTKLLVGFLVLWALGCNSLPPPASIRVDDTTPDVVANAIGVARDAWCAADVGWCPEISPFGEATVTVTRWREVGHGVGPGTTLEETGWTGPAGHEFAWAVEVAPEFATDLDMPGVLTHEFGHFAIEGHDPRSALMVAFHTDPIVPVVDEFARRDWLRGVH